jgi:hypothetical protein
MRKREVVESSNASIFEECVFFRLVAGLYLLEKFEEKDMMEAEIGIENAKVIVEWENILHDSNEILVS